MISPTELAISAAQDAARNKYATPHANAAHARMEAGEHVGKIVLEVGG